MRKYLFLLVIAFHFANGQSGAIDTSFNCNFPAQAGNSIAIQPDGKILVAAQTINNSNPYKVIRLNSDGTVDATFDDGFGANAFINKLKLQPDGKILIGGEFTSVNGVPFNYIARLNSDGSIDTTFNTGSGATDSVNDIALQSDGKILIVGVFNAYNNFSSSKIARLNTDGSIDSTFNVGSGFDETVEKVALQSDGKIVVSGTYVRTFNNTYIFGIARLNIDGSIDNTFTLYNTILGSDPLILGMILQNDGKIIIDGNFRENSIYKHKIVRLYYNGVFDSNFTIGMPNSAINGMSMQADGKILIYGYFTSYNSISRNGIVRLNTDGSVDTTFSAAITGNDGVWSVAVQQDKKIVANLYYSSSTYANNNRIIRLGYTPPPIATSQSLCYSSTVANLVATGSALQWYTVAIGGTALASTTVLASGIYYVSQTVSGVESLRAQVSVTLNTLPTTPGSITGTVAQGALVGTTTTATYSIAAVPGVASYFWTPPTGAYIVSGQGTTSVAVNFMDVPAGIGNIGKIMVQTVNDSGCKSVAKTLMLTKALPAAPSAIKMTIGSSATAITSFAKYMGTNTVLKLTANTVAAATSYEWELPTGVNRTDGSGINSTTPYIFVNFSGVTNTNTFNYSTSTGVSTNVLRIGVKAKNGVGVSVSNNATLINPITTSSAKQLTLTAVKPAAVIAVTGQIAGLCGGSTYTYTITDTALASSYTAVAPAGSVVTFTSGLTFTVTYPVGFVVTPTTPVADKTIYVTSVNGMGISATTKTLTLATTLAAVGVNTNSYSYVVPATGLTSLAYFTKCAPQTITVPAVPYATSYVWTLQNGATGTSTTNSIVVNFSAVSPLIATTKNIVKVKAYNGCTYSAEKSITLSWDGIIVCGTAKMDDPIVNSNLTVYPNPTSRMLFIEFSNNKTIDNVKIMDLLGKVIYEGKPENNQLNVEQLASGTYIIEVFSGTEKLQEKFIKN